MVLCGFFNNNNNNNNKKRIYDLTTGEHFFVQVPLRDIVLATKEEEEDEPLFQTQRERESLAGSMLATKAEAEEPLFQTRGERESLAGSMLDRLSFSPDADTVTFRFFLFLYKKKKKKRFHCH